MTATTDPPEVLRRALDRQAGRPHFDCTTADHRRRVDELARTVSADELHARLDALQVRHDPPAWERYCSCEPAGQAAT